MHIQRQYSGSEIQNVQNTNPQPFVLEKHLFKKQTAYQGIMHKIQQRNKAYIHNNLIIY